MPHLVGKALKFGPEYPGLPRVLPGYEPLKGSVERSWNGSIIDILDACDCYNRDTWVSSDLRYEKPIQENQR